MFQTLHRADNRVILDILFYLCLAPNPGGVLNDKLSIFIEKLTFHHIACCTGNLRHNRCGSLGQVVAECGLAGVRLTDKCDADRGIGGRFAYTRKVQALGYLFGKRRDIVSVFGTDTQECRKAEAEVVIGFRFAAPAFGFIHCRDELIPIGTQKADKFFVFRGGCRGF